MVKQIGRGEMNGREEVWTGKEREGIEYREMTRVQRCGGYENTTILGVFTLGLTKDWLRIL